jgi:hypothetical protein
MSAAGGGAATPFKPKKGWLKKKSPQGFLGIFIWQSRYCIVDQTHLRYYKSEPGPTEQVEASGAIALDDIEAVIGQRDENEFGIKVCPRRPLLACSVCW